MVTARDGAPDQRLATATVTVKVTDVEDEVPVFHQSGYEARVKENVPDYNVIQVTVSCEFCNSTRPEVKKYAIEYKGLFVLGNPMQTWIKRERVIYYTITQS